MLNGRELSKKDKAVIAAIDEIEAEMRRIGFWSKNPPKIEVANYLQSPSFELWLQCVFVPNARNSATEGKYPKNSQVGLMAMRAYDYHVHVDEAQNLIDLLYQFDKLITGK